MILRLRALSWWYPEKTLKLFAALVPAKFTKRRAGMSQVVKNPFTYLLYPTAKCSASCFTVSFLAAGC